MKFSSLSLSLISSFPFLISSIQAQKLGVNAFNLVGWEGCSTGMKKKIADSWEDAVSIGQSFVDTKINWNEAATLEYLRSPGFNEGVRTQIEDVLGNVATFGQRSWFWHPTPLKWKIFVHCDDWKKNASRNQQLQILVILSEVQLGPSQEETMVEQKRTLPS